MKLSNYIKYTTMICTLSSSLGVLAYTVHLINTTDGNITGNVNIAASSLICPNHEINIAPHGEEKIEIWGCCVKSINIYATSGTNKGQSAERDYGIACQDITLNITGDYHNHLRLETP
ncbi:MAG TPA: hypothetical protein VGW78_03685 [Candidatus Babeliales bacterium]|nr:hypothetical protein [Candidatus Babeliales bacterium]